MSDPTPSYDFDRDIQVDKTGADEFSATLTDRWNGLTGMVNGGFLSAVALSALGQRVSFPDPLVVSTFFLRPSRPGPVRISTEVAREGRRTATGEARIRSEDGRETVRTVATFADLGAASGRLLELGTPPELPDPEDCVNPMDALDMPQLTLGQRVEWRAPHMPGFLSGEPGDDPTFEFWMRFIDGRALDTVALAFLVDAAAPAVLEVGEFATSTMELSVHLRARPTSTWLACRVLTRHIAGGYHEEDMELWDTSGTLVAQSRQLAILG